MKRIYFFTVALFAIPFFLSAQQGVPDVTFDNDGYAFVPKPGTNLNTGYDLTVQPDGKIITVGVGQLSSSDFNWFKITRHNTNGSLDNTFGSSANGIIYLNPATNQTDGSSSPAYGVAVQPDGKIVITGAHTGYHDFLPSDYSTPVFRLNANGGLDNTFNGTGLLSLKIGTGTAPESASGVVIQPDGKIVIVGGVTLGCCVTLFVARINTNGTLDNTFNGTGIAYLPAGVASYGYGIKLQPDGKIVVGGTITIAGQGNDFVVARLNSNGSFDNSFDGDGIATIDFNGGTDNGLNLDLQPDGKIVMSGYTLGTTADLAMVRLTTTGLPDNSFDGDGKKIIDLGGTEQLNSVVAQPDGKLLFGGTQGSFAASNAKIVIVKLNTDGSPDNNYDGDGVGLYNFINGQVSSEGIALQADGKILSVGFGGNPSSPGGRVLARFTNLVVAGGPLPVVLSRFEVEKKDRTALLQWTSASEQNSSSFQVLHSANGRDYKPVGELKAAGNSSDAISYQFIHTAPGTGWNYYQLLMKDLDGKTTLSEVKKINFSNSEPVEILPNPTDGIIVVKHPLNGATSIRVFDVHGRMVMQKNVTNINQTELNLQSLTAGVYSVSVVNGGMSWSMKLVKK